MHAQAVDLFPERTDGADIADILMDWFLTCEVFERFAIMTTDGRQDEITTLKNLRGL